MKILVIQTAFLGDVILTLPLVQVLKEKFANAEIDVVVTPTAAPLLQGHPSIRTIIPYDKKGRDKGWGALRRLAAKLREAQYDIAVVPHRSLRSAILARLARIPVRIGFDRGAAPWLMTQQVPYDRTAHEVDRNLALLRGLGMDPPEKSRPTLQPSGADSAAVDRFLADAQIQDRTLIAVAPGSVWFTKRWPEERYAALVKSIEDSGMSAVMIGGPTDAELCHNIIRASGTRLSVSAAGVLSLLQSASLIGRCVALVTNDSAPLHIGVAMRTPVIALFGATVPSFGFAPYGDKDRVLETMGLACRPCAVHGGSFCPIKTFDCMLRISPASVMDAVKEVVV